MTETVIDCVIWLRRTADDRLSLTVRQGHLKMERDEEAPVLLKAETTFALDWPDFEEDFQLNIPEEAATGLLAKGGTPE